MIPTIIPSNSTSSYFSLYPFYKHSDNICQYNLIRVPFKFIRLSHSPPVSYTFPVVKNSSSFSSIINDSRLI